MKTVAVILMLLIPAMAGEYAKTDSLGRVIYEFPADSAQTAQNFDNRVARACVFGVLFAAVVGTISFVVTNRVRKDIDGY